MTTAQPPRASGTPKRELVKRFAAAIVLAPIVILCAWLGGLWFILLVALVIGIGAHEWSRLYGAPNVTLIVLSAVLGPIAAAALLTMGLGVALMAAACAGALVATTGLARGSRKADHLWSQVGLIYLAIPAAAILILRLDAAFGLADLLFLLGIVWLTDIGAYFFGRIIGGVRLAPSISPGKTWAGAIGGLVLALIGAYFAAGFPEVRMPLGTIPLAICLSVATQCGDLFESWVKRRFNRKDSGSIIPGHGGILDRIDGLLFAAPVMAAITIAQRGTVPLWP